MGHELTVVRSRECAIIPHTSRLNTKSDPFSPCAYISGCPHANQNPRIDDKHSMILNDGHLMTVHEVLSLGLRSPDISSRGYQLLRLPTGA